MKLFSTCARLALFSALGTSLMGASAFAQTAAQPLPAAQNAGESSAVQGVKTEQAPQQAAAVGLQSAPADLKIGAGDLIEMKVYGVPELGDEVRVSNGGEVNLALVGKVKIADLTTDQAQTLIENKLRDGGYVRDPHVSLFVKEYATQGVSVLGEVSKPGVYPLLGARRLFDVISAAGGTTDRAGRVVTITHRDAPTAPQTVTMPRDPTEAAKTNVEVRPGDTIMVSKAGVVYVVGEVGKPSGFVMDNNDSITVLQALALAEGPTKVAALDKTRLIRKGPNGMEEVPVSLKKILETKAPDVAMKADDVLFIPTSGSKSAGRRTLDSILAITTGIAIYGPK